MSELLTEPAYTVKENGTVEDWNRSVNIGIRDLKVIEQVAYQKGLPIALEIGKAVTLIKAEVATAGKPYHKKWDEYVEEHFTVGRNQLAKYQKLYRERGLLDWDDKEMSTRVPFSLNNAIKQINETKKAEAGDAEAPAKPRKARPVAKDEAESLAERAVKTGTGNNYLIAYLEAVQEGTATEEDIRAITTFIGLASKLINLN